MVNRTPDELKADGLDQAALAELKRKELEGRNAGAATFLTKVRRLRGPFRCEAEELAVLEALSLGPSDVVLDAGSGVGRYAFQTAERVKRLYCLDFSEQALVELRKEAERRGLSNINARTADLTEPLPVEEKCDAAYSNETIQHIATAAGRRAALENIRNVLKPGGRCVVLTIAWSRRIGQAKEGYWPGERGGQGAYRIYYTAREIAALMESAGFRNVRVRGLIVLPGILMRRLPVRLHVLELWLSKLRVGINASRMLIATGEAPR